MTQVRGSATGFGIIEILVSLLVLSVGLLGIAALHARAQQAEAESYQRTQALILLNDMASRINTNKKAAGCYHLDTEAVGVGLTPPTECTAFGTIETQALAVQDLTAWSDALKGRAERAEDSATPPLIGARGCIVANSSFDQITITIAWQGLSPTVAPAATCGQDQYGDERLRRAVTSTVQLTDLQP